MFQGQLPLKGPRAQRDWVLGFVRSNADRFADLFPAWLSANFGIWRAFCHLADKAARAGRTHYSARTIIEVLRWETEIREHPSQPFKINNNAVPSMAKLYNVLTGVELFNLREREEYQA